MTKEGAVEFKDEDGGDAAVVGLASRYYCFSKIR